MNNQTFLDYIGMLIEAMERGGYRVRQTMRDRMGVICAWSTRRIRNNQRDCRGRII